MVIDYGQSDRSLASIQMLRAVAATGVVVYHAQVMLHHTAGYIYSEHNTGAAGVDIFFIISGFVMYFTNRDQFQRPGASGRFLLRRIIRIVPTYWVYTTLMTALLLFLPGMFQEMKFGVSEAIGSYLFLLFVNTNGQIGPNIGVGWTLSFEMYFYLLFAIFLHLSRRFLLVGLGTIFVCGMLIRQFMAEISPQAQLFTNPLLLEFLLGCCLGALVCRNRYPTVLLAMVLCVFGALAIFIAGQMNLLGDRFEPQRVIIFGIPAACIVYGALTLEVNQCLKVPPFLVALGDSSYSIYLVQVFTIPVVGKTWKALGLANHVGPWAALAAGVGISIMAAHILYLCFERPLIQYLRRQAAQRLGR
ncbi:MAG TPA: acyltransferase [Burkholderiales bacterium]|nr:acyltransferase [Burkholderiales bacterium]